MHIKLCKTELGPIQVA